MPSRDVRDAQQAEVLPASSAPPAQEPTALSSLQIPLDARLQRLAVAMVLEDFEAAKQARETMDYGISSKGEKLTFDVWLKELTDLYFGRREPKTEPWRFCSNRSMGIAMAILEVLHARMFPAVYNEELTHWRPGDVTDVPKAERIEKLMFWWVRVRAKLREFFDRWARLAIGYGRVVTETSWEVQLIDKGGFSPAQSVQNPDGAVTVTPEERIFEPFETSRSDLIPESDVFFQPGAMDLQRDSLIIRRKYLYRELEEMEANGQAINVTVSTVPGQLALKEALPVPGMPSDASSVSPEVEEELRNVKRRNLTVEILEAYTALDIDGRGSPTPVRLLINPQHQLYLGGIAQRDLSYRGMRHLDVTLFMPRLDDPTGLRGLGVLEQVKELALEIDAIFNQMTDANTLQVLRPGFYDPSGELDTGAMKLAPNKLTPVPNPQANLYFPEFHIPTERLINAIKLVLEFIERLTAASSYVMGKESEIVGGSGTATRTQAIVGAANERHAIPVQRLREGAARILTQHLDLIQKHLPPGLESRILGQRGEPVFGENELSQQGIAGEFDAYLLPDEAMGSKETERQLAQLLYTTMLPNPIIATDPTKLYKVSADYFKAFGKDPEAYLGPAPDLNAARSPEDEHTLILQGDFEQVRATVTQNPIQHLMSHQAFLQDPEVVQLNPMLQQQVVAFLQAHIQEHMTVMQALLQLMASPPKGVPNGSQSRGATPRGTRSTQTVGPEPGMGSVRHPLAAARQTQGNGESAVVAGGP